MELCTIEDAFPNIGGGGDAPYAGGKDAYSSREERRAAKKLRAKRIKAEARADQDRQVTGVDPDRPAVERMAEVETVQKEKEAFALPVLPKASCLFSESGLPKYFENLDDGMEEGFSSFNPSPIDDANYRLYPDFTKGGMLKGAEKAASQNLPEPVMNDQWKPMTDAASYSAYYDVQDTKVQGSAKPRGVKGPPVMPAVLAPSNDSAKDKNNDALLKRIDELMGRLDQLEKKNVRDSQTEILMFVGTGIFILVSFEILTRR